MAKDKPKFPGWRYNPATGEGEIFQSADEVPKGWTDNQAEAIAAAAAPKAGNSKPAKIDL
jgi:hypothetical protein